MQNDITSEQIFQALGEEAFKNRQMIELIKQLSDENQRLKSEISILKQMHAAQKANQSKTKVFKSPPEPAPTAAPGSTIAHEPEPGPGAGANIGASARIRPGAQKGLICKSGV